MVNGINCGIKQCRDIFGWKLIKSIISFDYWFSKIIYVGGWFGDILSIIKILPVFQTVIGKALLKMIFVSCTNVKWQMIKEQWKGNMKWTCISTMQPTIMNYIVLKFHNYDY